MLKEAHNECKNCGKAFEPTCHKMNQKYCSDACRIKYNNAKRYFNTAPAGCPECGAVVEQTDETGRRRRFCGDRCRKLYHARLAQERRNNQQRPSQMCPNCGIAFQQDWGQGKQRRFCSDICRQEWWAEYHKAHPKETPHERSCRYCGKTYISATDREYCNRGCYLKAMAATHTQRICEWCGDEFSTFVSNPQKYCCKTCAGSARHSVVHRKIRRYRAYDTPEQWHEKIQHDAQAAGRSAGRGRRVFLVCGNTGMYTRLDGLLGIIRYKLRRNPFDGNLYVFCSPSGTMLKYLNWDGAGFCYGKRQAQRGRYPWLSTPKRKCRITPVKKCRFSADR